MTSLTAAEAYRALGSYRDRFSARHMRDLFAADPGRARRYSATLGPLHLDYSKNRIDDEGLGLLFGLARERGVESARDAMLSGEKINFTEGRAVLHTALRAPPDVSIHVDGADVVPGVHEVLDRMAVFSERLRSGEWLGATGKPISDVVNIGIGGSHLGPQMVTEALAAFARPEMRTHFVSNVDGADIGSTLDAIDPETALFVVASKSFTTQETMTNAHTARDWFLASGRSLSDVPRHFVAVSTNAEAVSGFGIDPDNMFGFWSWVGGRYSLWSAIGLPIALSIGMTGFRDLLAGARAMDEHFATAPLEENLPVILAMLGVWYINFLDAPTHAVLPYCEYLDRLPDYLQQADMESNGKLAQADGSTARHATGPVVWGSTGTNGQHAYFQLLHQGSHLVPADFIAVVNPPRRYGSHHDLLLANCLAQTEALMLGRDPETTAAAMRDAGADEDSLARLVGHRQFAGNRPSNTVVLEALTPRSLGMLIALYEHKIFVQGVTWGINSFDQWGVELGKQLAGEIYPELTSGPGEQRNPSTAALIELIRKKTIE